MPPERLRSRAQDPLASPDDEPQTIDRESHHLQHAEMANLELEADRVAGDDRYTEAPGDSPFERAVAGHLHRRPRVHAVRMRQAIRLYDAAQGGRLPSAEELTTIEAEDVLKSRVFQPRP